MNWGASVRTVILCAILIFLHYTLRPLLSWRAAPDFLIIALLLASVRVRPGVAALFGFVGFFLTYDWWVYPVGAGIALLGFARAAPTTSHLHDDQLALVVSGCSLSLVHALRGGAPPGAGAAGSS